MKNKKNTPEANENNKLHSSLYRYYFLYFFAIFFILMALIALFQYQHEQTTRAENFDTRLTFCNEMIDNYISHESQDWDDIDSFTRLMPDQTMRFTVIDKQGNVIYDSFFEKGAYIENHLDRPEIVALQNSTIGKDIRHSHSTGHDYYYVAERFPDYYVRSALPYTLDLRSSLKANLSFLYYMSGILLLALLAIYFLSKRFSKNVAESETRVRRQLTQNISHELKTPVSGILGFMESILENPTMDAERQRFFVERSYQQAQRLQSLLQDISVLNKLDEAPHLYERQQCDIIEIINDILADVHLQIEERKAQVVVDLPDSMPIVGNKSLLYSIFRNLIDNALAYAGEGVVIHITSHKNEGFFYHISLSDNGVGVPENHIRHIFERFYRVDAGRSRKLGGTGLGLSIVKNAVVYHQGTISVRNLPSSGLCFTFTLHKR